MHAIYQDGGVRGKSLEAARSWFVASVDAQSISLLQLITRGDLPDGDDVYPFSLVAAPGRGPSLRARDRYLPRDGALLVEPL